MGWAMVFFFFSRYQLMQFVLFCVGKQGQHAVSYETVHELVSPSHLHEATKVGRQFFLSLS